MPDWAPTPDQVAALLRARTQGAATMSAPQGSELGKFTASTRPTRAQVEELIELACAEVGARFAGRTPCTTDLESAAGVAAAYKVCQQIEVGYFPEASRGEGSAFEGFGRLYEQAASGVAVAIVASCPLDTPSSGEDVGTLAPAGRGHGRVLIGPSQVRW